MTDPNIHQITGRSTSQSPGVPLTQPESGDQCNQPQAISQRHLPSFRLHDGNRNEIVPDMDSDDLMSLHDYHQCVTFIIHRDPHL
jgi:hypothetical protein